jgi:hypothetical protein
MDAHNLRSENFENDMFLTGLIQTLKLIQKSNIIKEVPNSLEDLTLPCFLFVAEK